MDGGRCARYKLPPHPLKEGLIGNRRITTALAFLSYREPIFLQVEVGAKPDAEHLKKLLHPSGGSGKRDSSPRTQPQSNRLVTIDFDSYYRLISVDFFSDFVNLAVAYHESWNKVEYMAGVIVSCRTGFAFNVQRK